jgi:hypothetical protein
MILKKITVRARVVLTTLALGLALLTSSCGLIGATVSTAVALAPLKLLFACLPEGTEIDLPGGETQPIEDLRSGDVVMGYGGKPVKITQIHGYLEDPEETDFYEITFSNGASVDLCGMHRIEDIRAQDLKVGSTLPSGLSVVAMRTYRGVERSYDILTEDKGYQVGGVSVNSMIEEMYRAGRQNDLPGE